MRVLTAVHLATDDTLCILHRDLADRLVDIHDKRDERNDNRDGDNEDHIRPDAAGVRLNRDDAFLDEIRNTGHDGSEDQHGNAVADSLFGDALAEPHQECGTCRCADRDDRETQNEQSVCFGDDVFAAGQNAVVGHDNTDRLNNRKTDARITRDALDLFTTVLLLAHPLESRNRNGEQLQDNGRRDVRRNTHCKDRELRERGTRHEAHEVAHGRQRFRRFLPTDQVDARDRDSTAKTVDHDEKDRVKDLLSEVFDLERVDECAEHQITSTFPPAFLMASSADFENFAALTVSCLLSSPLPRTFRPSFSSLPIMPSSFRSSPVTSVPFSNPFRSEMLMIVYSFAK